ncbi:MAG: histone H1 [Thermoanaerobaculia bacterium]
MPKGSSKKPNTKSTRREDTSQAARRIVDSIIEKTEADAQPDPEQIEITPEMRAAAAAFGRIGGLKGGPARAAKLSPKKRSDIAKKAAATRWSNNPK